MGKHTQIRIKIETREQLKSLGKMGDTYDDIIKELLNCSDLSETRFATPNIDKEILNKMAKDDISARSSV